MLWWFNRYPKKIYMIIECMNNMIEKIISKTGSEVIFRSKKNSKGKSTSLKQLISLTAKICPWNWVLQLSRKQFIIHVNIYLWHQVVIIHVCQWMFCCCCCCCYDSFYTKCNEIRTKYHFFFVMIRTSAFGWFLHLDLHFASVER